jgi:predicted 2-oxoglutarate/Fe(II)-dependent dioxygenase YbiX
MEIINFIKLYDEVMPWKTLSNLIRFANTAHFEKASIIGNGNDGVIDQKIRKTNVYPLTRMSESMSNVHWASLLENYFSIGINKYYKDINAISWNWRRIIDISILKYENKGFYTWHTDHAAEIPRTMSCILLLNNDYEGGELCFRNPDGSGEWGVEVKPNRMIIWPSNFLYPHTVKPVTKGKRYSVVAWAL